MATVDESKVWRVIARINDQIIVKNASSVEKAIRSARNAVCVRLCGSADIEYELGWWKGMKHRARRDFVDNFLGKPLYVIADEPPVVELHDVPYEVYTVEQVRLTFRKMSLMTPDNIDAWGYLHWGTGDNEKIQLLGESLPIPRHLTASKSYEEEEVIAISDAQTCLEKCPDCKEDIPFGTILLVTENFRLLPTQCCGKMIWSRENLTENNEDWV
jgi:hypothetical protein